MGEMISSKKSLIFGERLLLCLDGVLLWRGMPGHVRAKGPTPLHPGAEWTIETVNDQVRWVVASVAQMWFRMVRPSGRDVVPLQSDNISSVRGRPGPPPASGWRCLQKGSVRHGAHKVRPHRHRRDRGARHHRLRVREGAARPGLHHLGRREEAPLPHREVRRQDPLPAARRPPLSAHALRRRQDHEDHPHPRLHQHHGGLRRRG